MDYYGRTLGEAIYNAVYRKQNTLDNYEHKTRRNHFIAAPSLRWGEWKQIWAVIGGDQPINLEIEFKHKGRATSLFDLQIRGAARDIQMIGPASAQLYIAANTATGIYIRARSHGLLAQKIQVHVS